VTSNDLWTVKAALDWTVGYLERKGDSHPRLSAEWLLSAATGLSRVELYAFFDRPLSSEERATLREGVKRRANGEPLQYVSGEVGFRHIVVRTAPGVLIPRPETEVLVDVGLVGVDAALEAHGSAHVLDLCTGSGVIALSVLHERPNTVAFATDISQTAVDLAQRNANALGLDSRCTICCCDLAEGVPADGHGTFDLLISNPPYIPSAEVDTLDAEITRFEPRVALDGGQDGLDVFRRILDEAPRLLSAGGMLACELHEDRVQEAAGLIDKNLFHGIETHRDLAGRDRVVSAVLN